MTHADSLGTIAIIAALFLGFSASVMMLRGRGDGRALSPMEAYRTVNLFVFPALTLFLALLPEGLASFGLLGWQLWSVSSGAMFAVVAAWAVARMLRLSRIEDAAVEGTTRFAALNGSVALAILALQLLNTTGIAFEPHFGPFYLGLQLLLVVVFLQLFRAVFVPWKR